MERRHLLYKAASLSYIRFGAGPKPAFCFHGYGEEATSFAFLEKYAGSEFTFFAIDLPFHGQTKWPANDPFTTPDLQNVVSGILLQESPELISNKVTLLGYSLGGRVALNLLQTQPLKVDKIVLLAPDGLKINFWYWLATQTWPGNKLFAFTMKHPGWFFAFLKLLNKLKLVNASIFKFVNYYIGDSDARNQLYQRWTSLRQLRPNLSKIKSDINEQAINIQLIYGKHDRIILSTVGERFKKGIEKDCVITIIHAGHQLLNDKHAGELLPALLA